MQLNLAELGAALDDLEAVEPSVEKLIDDLMAQVAANVNDPVALKAMVDRVLAVKGKLAAKVANTSGTPVTPPIA